jgi:hypothetical protein
MKQPPITSHWSVDKPKQPIIQSFDMRLLLTDHQTRRQRVLLPAATLLRKFEPMGVCSRDPALGKPRDGSNSRRQLHTRHGAVEEITDRCRSMLEQPDDNK